MLGAVAAAAALAGLASHAVGWFLLITGGRVLLVAVSASESGVSAATAARAEQWARTVETGLAGWGVLLLVRLLLDVAVTILASRALRRGSTPRGLTVAVLVLTVLAGLVPLLVAGAAVACLQLEAPGVLTAPLVALAVALAGAGGLLRVAELVVAGVLGLRRTGTRPVR